MEGDGLTTLHTRQLFWIYVLYKRVGLTTVRYSSVVYKWLRWVNMYVQYVMMYVMYEPNGWTTVLDGTIHAVLYGCIGGMSTVLCVDCTDCTLIVRWVDCKFVRDLGGKWNCCIGL
jgi:hypothetical protein